jgi:hypothetical protein
MDPDTSWRLKVGRAKEHFAALGTEIKAWAESSPMAIVKEKDAEGRGHTVFAEIVRRPPLNRWSLIAGDCVHNLRSALDSLVYGIAVHETGANPPGDEKTLQFPITSSLTEFEKQKYRIKSLSPALQFEIEKTQPYNVPHPELPPLLSLLNFFDNFDKHRMLNVVAAVPYNASVEMLHSPNRTMSSAKIYRTAVEGKTEIFSFTVEPPDPNLEYRCEAFIVICIGHLPGPSKSPFNELAGVLHWLIEAVERIVGGLEAIVGEMRPLPMANPVQVAQFEIDKSGRLVVKPA